MALDQLARIWEYPPAATEDTLRWLRTLGYEVRSEHTNRQIPDGHVLIPYAFPTLTPLSVQLRKTLFPADKAERLPSDEEISPDE